AGRRADASVPRHVRAAGIADSARAHHGRRLTARPHGARHARQGTTSSGETVKSLPIVIALVAGVAVMAAQPPTQQPAAQQPPAQQPPAPQRPSFRGGVDVVSLNVIVTDGTAHYVTDLDPAEFNVFEDGVKQDVTF